MDRYRVYWSLADTKRAGTGLLVRRSIAAPEVSYSLAGGGEPSASGGMKVPPPVVQSGEHYKHSTVHVHALLWLVILIFCPACDIQTSVYS